MLESTGNHSNKVNLEVPMIEGVNWGERRRKQFRPRKNFK